MDIIPLVLGDQNDESFFSKYVSLMTRYLNDVLYVVNQTRDYHHGLHFCDELDALNDRFLDEGKLRSEQHHEYHCSIASFRLDMYDNLDYWEDFVRYHDELLESTSHVVMWAYEEDHPTRLKRYFVSTDGLNSQLHWLFKHHKRYVLIEKKLAKLRSDGKVKNLKHKRQSELTEVEVRERFNRAMEMVQLWRGT